jgi:hypothetical protein
VKQALLAATTVIVALASPMPTHAREWFMIDASNKRCTDSAATAADAVKSGLPPIFSPYDASKELEREHIPYTTTVTRDASGKVGAVQIVVDGSVSTFWFRSRDFCERALGWLLAKELAAPSDKRLSRTKAKPNQSHASTQEVPNHFSGIMLSEACLSQDETYNFVCIGYTKGVADDWTTTIVGAGSEPLGLMHCAPQQHDENGLLAITRRYILDHPKELPQSAAKLLMGALLDPFACKPGKAPADQMVAFHATGADLAAACISKDRKQHFQCIGYLQGVFDAITDTLTNPKLRGLRDICAPQAQDIEELRTRFLKLVVNAPEYQRSIAADVLFAAMIPPAPCPLRK